VLWHLACPLEGRSRRFILLIQDLSHFFRQDTFLFRRQDGIHFFDLLNRWNAGVDFARAHSVPQLPQMAIALAEAQMRVAAECGFGRSDLFSEVANTPQQYHGTSIKRDLAKQMREAGALARRYGLMRGSSTAPSFSFTRPIECNLKR
jgi:hypothetical protein